MNQIDIAKVAQKYIGKTEKPNNSGFTDADFEKRMKDVGWQKGQAWCSYFCELVCKEALPELNHILDELFNASATQTWQNFDIAKMTSKEPKIGSMIVWRYGNGWKGHIGIVTAFANEQKTKVQTIEGNTNDKGGREGYIVTQKIRKTDLPYSDNNLNLIGFINLC